MRLDFWFLHQKYSIWLVVKLPVGNLHSWLVRKELPLSRCVIWFGLHFRFESMFNVVPASQGRERLDITATGEINGGKASLFFQVIPKQDLRKTLDQKRWGEAVLNHFIDKQTSIITISDTFNVEEPKALIPQGQNYTMKNFQDNQQFLKNCLGRTGPKNSDSKFERICLKKSGLFFRKFSKLWLEI